MDTIISNSNIHSQMGPSCNILDEGWTLNWLIDCFVNSCWLLQLEALLEVVGKAKLNVTLNICFAPVKGLGEKPLLNDIRFDSVYI